MSTQYVSGTLPFISCFLQEFWVPWNVKTLQVHSSYWEKCKALSRTSWVYNFSLLLSFVFLSPVFTVVKRKPWTSLVLSKKQRLAGLADPHLPCTLNFFSICPTFLTPSNRSQEQFVGKKKEELQESFPGLGWQLWCQMFPRAWWDPPQDRAVVCAQQTPVIFPGIW